MATTITAQANNGRFCVRLFEDLNDNTVQEAGEPTVTQGIVADLRARGSQVILQSMLVQNSPEARRGEVCFTDLALGQYEIMLKSASYAIPTGDNTVFTELTATQPVIISSYGVSPRLVSASTQGDANSVDQDEVLERAVISLAGALIAMAVMAFIGIMVYVVMMRPKRQAVAASDYSPPDGEARFRRPDTQPTGEHLTASVDPAADTGEHQQIDL